LRIIMIMHQRFSGDVFSLFNLYDL
jgi:hypothetical protein